MMIKLSNLADYAVVLMSHIALRPEHVFPATEISAETGIPAPTVSKILGMLVKAGLLTSHRGLNGGFSLQGRADEITVADIIEAVDGPVQLTNCLDLEHSDCDYQSNCGTRSKWHNINLAVKAALSSVRLSEMLSPIPDFINSDMAGPDYGGSKTPPLRGRPVPALGKPSSRRDQNNLSKQES